MLQDYSTIFQTAITILSAIITGGFVLVYVELSNKKTREIDNYEQLMRPFMHKLSAYLRFVSWCQYKIRIPKTDLRGGEKEFKRVLDTLASYGGRAIVSGGDYRVNSFSAEQLYDISTNHANHIWYLTHHKHSCNLQWDSSHDFNDKFIRKEMEEINPHYKDLPITLDTFIKVSAEFHTEIYQMIEADTDIHETRMWLLKIHTRIVTCALFSVLLLLCILIVFSIPGWTIQLVTVSAMIGLTVSLLLLGTDYSSQLRFYKQIKEHKKIMKTYITHRLLEPIGLLFLLGAFCWQTISDEKRNQYEQIYQSKIDNVLISTADLVAFTAFRDTLNYKGEMVTNFNPEDVQKATSAIYEEQEVLAQIYNKHRKYHLAQVVFYILGSLLVLTGAFVKTIKTIH